MNSTYFNITEEELNKLIVTYGEKINSILSKELKENEYLSYRISADDNTERLYFTCDKNYVYKERNCVVTVIYFSLQLFPNNAEILLSLNLWVEQDFRNKGIASILMDLKKEITKACKFNFLLCTVNKTNAPEIHILEKTGWNNIADLATSSMYLLDLTKKEN